MTHWLEHRIPPPLVCAIAAAGMWAVARATPVIAIDSNVRWAIVAALGLFSLLVAGLGVAAFSRARTTIDPVQIEAASALVTGGIYRWTRNPMYVGLTALLLAWAVYLAAPLALLGPLAFALFIGRFQIIPEERMLRAKFGRAYEEYLGRVRRWL